jgi:hypothetical protein
MSEQTFLDTLELVVTSNRVSAGGKTYATHHITTVRGMHKSPSRTPWLVAIFFGILIIGACLVPLNSGGIVFGAAVIGFGFYLLKIGRTVYAAVITIDGRDVIVTRSTDSPAVDAALAALKAAIAHRI